MKNSSQKRRSLIVTALILAVALGGLLFVNTEKGGADGFNPKAMTHPVAESDNSSSLTEPVFADSVLPSLFKMISALIVVVACIYIGLYLLKRMMGRQHTGEGRHGVLEVMETTCVAPKKTVSLIRVKDKSVLVGVTDNQITVLTELDVHQTASILESRSERMEKDTFGELLRAASNKIKKIGLTRKRAALEA
ncbi:MAG: flagellar biosynthetic protein FliO [candidate division Zixibacteria bacterium]|nr:flagellar biosynthetic protein FliO [candidate division Zixibacteria bacterium]